MNTENASQEKLLIAVVQSQDSEIVVDVLENESFSVTRLPSVGGFLGQRNVTLLMGVTENLVSRAKELLEKTCRKRVAFIAVPVENAPLSMPMPTPVTVGGVSIFSLDIEHHEEI
jgi:uncharacterized protein YaaQ